MIGDLFDSPWKILIVAVVIIVLFGSKKLPHAARSLGQSMRILKTEVSSMHEDESAPSTQEQAPATGFPGTTWHAGEQNDCVITWRSLFCRETAGQSGRAALVH